MRRGGRLRRGRPGAARALLRLLVVLAAAGPAAALPPGKTITQLRHDAWQTKDGLPQNSVDAIVQTRDGFLWLGTQEGLARFDGVTFDVFDRRNVPALRHNRILALCEDRTGGLWIGTEGGGLTLHRGSTFRTFTVADGLPSDIVSALAASPDGGVWAGTPRGVTRVTGDAHPAMVPSLAGVDAETLLEDRGALWVGTRGKGLLRLESSSLSGVGAAEGLASGSVAALASASGGGIWIGTRSGVARVVGGRAAPVVPTPAPVRALLEDRDGAVWIGTDGEGLLRLAGGKLQRFGILEGFPDGTVGALFEDREGNVWAGTQDGGLQRFADGAFTPVTKTEGLSSDVVWAIAGDGADGLWIGTKDGGANHLGPDGRVTPLGSREGLSDPGVQALWRDPDGTLWLGTRRGGLNRWKGGRIAVFGTNDGPNVSAILRDRSGTLWVGTRTSGLQRLVDGARLERVTGPGAPGTAAIYALLEDRAGSIWIGTNGGGLVRFRGGVFTAFTEKDGLPIAIVNTLLEDERGVLWIGTYGGGLARLKDGRFATVSTKQGLYDDAVFGLVEDGRGDFWISCNRGVYRVSRAALDEAADSGKGPVSATVFGVDDGMKSRECNGANQPAAWRARDGRLWFATVRGAVAVDPAHLPRNGVPPPVAVEEILVDGVAADPGAPLRFAPGAENLEIRYTAPSFTDPARVRFRIRLEGYDHDWVEAGARRTAYYTHLPPGDYRFRVKAANDAGVWNEDGASLAFRFEPALTQTTTFWLAATMLVSGLVALGVRSRLRRIAEREAELVSLVAERTRQLEDANRDLKLLSSTDALTGIANRRAFDDFLRLFWTQARRSGAAISVLMIDCDDFKGYNDSYGHLRGDECLRKVAEALTGAVSRTGDIVARFGGEEFAVLLLETPLSGCEAVAERMRASVEALGLESTASAYGHVTVSVGAATAYPGSAFGADALVERADGLLYRAKRAGKNRVVVAEAPLGAPAHVED